MMPANNVPEARSAHAAVSIPDVAQSRDLVGSVTGGAQAMAASATIVGCETDAEETRAVRLALRATSRPASE